MNAWKDSRKEVGSEVINYSLQNILKLFVNLSSSGNQSRYKWWKKTESCPSVIYVTNPKTIICRCRHRPTIANCAVEHPPIPTEMGHRQWMTDGDWLLCLTCLCDWYSLLQCVGVLTLILTLKLIFRQSKQSQGLPTLLFFDYFKGLVIWKRQCAVILFAISTNTVVALLLPMYHSVLLQPIY